MTQNVLKKALFLTLACACLTGTALAAEQEQVQLSQFILDEYVVTDSRVQTKLVDTPANISVITQEQLEKGNYTNVKEVLRDVPGVQISQAGNSGSSMGKDEIIINGDDRVLVLIDGRRMNLGGDGRYSANWLPPLEAIERIEVVKGASSAMYGSDAVGGVINVITKSGGDQKTTVKAGYGSFGQQDYTLSTGGRKGGFGYYITGNMQKRNDFSYKNADTGRVERMEHSGYDSNSLFLKMDKEIGKNGKLTLNIEHLSINSEVPLYFNYNELTTLADQTKRLSNNAALRYDWNVDTDQSGFVQLYQNYQTAHYNSMDKAGMQSDFNERTFGLTAQQNFQTHAKNKMAVGINWQRTTAQNTALFNNVDGVVENKAIYIEDRWQLDESWQINSGLRYDHYNKSGGKPTLHLAVNKKFNEDSHAYLSWGQVFRAPSAQDLYWNQADAWGFTTKGDPNLKPESGQVFTIGYDTKIAANTKVGLSAFYSDINDAIYWDYKTTPGITQARNANREKRRGFDIYLNHKFNDAWSAYASYTYVKADRDENNGLGFVSDLNTKPNIYKFSVRYDKNNWTVEGTLRGASGQSEKYSKNSYFTMDINAQYKITKNLKAYLNIYNLNNAAYEEAPMSIGKRFPMPSRTIIGGIQVTF